MGRKTITIVTVGTRGDVQPYIALGLGLEGAGYQVRIAAPAALNGLIAQYGLTALPIHAVNPQAFLGQTAVQDAAKRKAPLSQLVALLREARPLMSGFVEEVWQACQGSDAIIASTIFYGAQDSAEKLGVPCIHTFLHPLFPTTTVPSPLVPRLPVSVGVINRASHDLVNQLLWQAFRPVVNAFRKRLDLSPQALWGPYHLLHQRNSLVLLGFSPAVFPKPGDWPNHVHVTGYWFLDEPADWTPPEALVSFLENGPPPIYVGFGSMMDQAADGTTQLVVDALTRVGQRAVLASSWHRLRQSELPDTMFPIESVPHSWLFPRMAAVTHHGGAGTTGTGFRSGVPSIILPFLGDQLFWAKRAAALGVGPEPIVYSKLTTEALADRFLTAATDQRMRERAKRLGEIVRADDGVGKAVGLITRQLTALSGFSI